MLNFYPLLKQYWIRSSSNWLHFIQAICFFKLLNSDCCKVVKRKILVKFTYYDEYYRVLHWLCIVWWFCPTSDECSPHGWSTPSTQRRRISRRSMRSARHQLKYNVARLRVGMTAADAGIHRVISHSSPWQHHASHLANPSRTLSYHFVALPGSIHSRTVSLQLWKLMRFIRNDRVGFNVQFGTQ